MKEPYYYCVTMQGTVDAPMSQLPSEVLRDIAAGAPLLYRGEHYSGDGLRFVRIYAAVLLKERGAN